MAGASPTAPAALTNRFVDAVGYATELHLRQTRKGSGVPYAGHLLGVCSLVLEEGGDEDEAIAALLHDAGEDQGGEERLADIRRRYGAGVESIVRACSDTLLEDKPDWRTRKEEYLAHLEHQPAPVLLVSLADKLFNARAILRDYHAAREELWNRFTGDRDGQLWYYRRLSDAFRRLLPDARMTRELADVVLELEQASAAVPSPGKP
jgi:(p)ppGpp synthase/HD superfamily hydrolase